MSKIWPVAAWREKFIASVCLKRRNNNLLKAVLLVCLAALLSGAVLLGFKDNDNFKNTAKNLEQLQVENITEISGNTAQNAEGDVKLKLDKQVKMSEAVAEENSSGKALPLPVGKVNQKLGWYYNEYYKDWRYHTGFDIAGTLKDNVVALQSGSVKEVSNDMLSGLTAVVESGDILTYYGALAECNVKAGNKLAAGEKIGIIGTSPGEDYPHLHIAVKQGSGFIEPDKIFN